MIRVTIKNYWKEETGDQSETRVIDYPGATATMPFGSGSVTAVVKESSPGVQEVIAMLDTVAIDKIEEVPDEG